MKASSNMCAVVFRNLWLLALASGCSASGAATTGTGGHVSQVHTGGAPASSSDGGAGNSPSGNGGNVTGTGGVPGGGGTPAATGGMPATGGTTCTPGTQIGFTQSGNYFVMSYPTLAPFWIFNNGWSSTATSLTTAGALENITAYDTCTAGTISWSTTYNWTGNNSQVAAYPAAILGWQNTKGFPVANSGLPRTISSLTSLKCSWNYTISGGATQDVAFDIWVHNGTCSASAITSTTTPSDEVMVWLYRSGGVNPLGSSTSSPTVAGQSWGLYSGTTTVNGASVAVHSYVLNSTTSTGLSNLDLLALLNNLGLGSKCLSSVEAGTEIFNGSGTLKTNSYTCTLQ